MKLYIAGRIADEPDYRVKFARACTEVLLLDHEPVNPCEIHHEGVCCSHATWEQWMVCDLHALLDCDGVYALRDWKASKGATIEIQLAMRLGKTIIYQPQLIKQTMKEEG
jgi:hypothetical protein